MEGNLPYVVEPMQMEDIAEVTAVERLSFTTPWPPYAYRRELKDNRNSRYIVVRWMPDGARVAGPEADATEPTDTPTNKASTERPSSVRWPMSRLLPFWRQKEAPAANVHRGRVVGYAGLWIILDEGHVTTIAVQPDLRGRGLGELLLVRLVHIAKEMGAERMTLEVRMSNESAQSLYRKYTFTPEGVRRRYYSDDNEDALIMWSKPLASPEFNTQFETMEAALVKRLGNELASSPLT